MRRSLIAARKAVGCGQGDPRPAPGGFRPFGIGDSLDGAGRVLGLARPGDQQAGRRLFGIGHLEAWRRPGNLIRPGDAAMGIFRNRARHRHGAFRQPGEGLRFDLAPRYAGLASADEDAQAQVAPFRPLDHLDIAEPLGVRKTVAFDKDGVGRIGAGGPRGLQQVFKSVQMIGHRSGRPSIRPGFNPGLLGMRRILELTFLTLSSPRRRRIEGPAAATSCLTVRNSRMYRACHPFSTPARFIHS